MTYDQYLPAIVAESLRDFNETYQDLGDYISYFTVDTVLWRKRMHIMYLLIFRWWHTKDVIDGEIILIKTTFSRWSNHRKWSLSIQFL